MKKGFTLIELLAVIVVIAIVLVIAVPIIFDVIEKAKKGVIESNIKLVIDTIEKKIAIDETFDYEKVDETNIYERLGIKPTNYADLVVTNVNGEPRVLIIGQDKFEGYTAYGDYNDIEVVNSEDYDVTPPVITLLGDNPLEINQGDTYAEPGATANDNKDGDITGDIVISGTVDINTVGSYILTYTVEDELGNNAAPVTRTVNVVLPVYAGPEYISKKGVNGPVLATGMVPIKWNGSAWEDTTINDTAWYDYKSDVTANKKWANARTADGSFWVWIPRYIYKISSGWHSGVVGTVDIQFSKGINDNWNNIVIGNINTDTTANASNNTWTNHTAFSFGTTELMGIWVAKFEASVANTADACYTAASDTACNKTTLVPKIAPYVYSWRYISVGNAFTVSRNMETNNTYGWGTSGTGIDTHMMKNTEWGAITYLSKSIYGQNDQQIWINPNNTFRTGCAGTGAFPASGATCNQYYTGSGVHASTTGNIYGVYDMAGGSYEYTTAYVKYGVNGSLQVTGNGASIVSANAKYKDVYSTAMDTAADNYSTTIDFKGDAVYETSGNYELNTAWFADYSYMPYQLFPWFVRGGRMSGTNNSGIFNFEFVNGTPAVSNGFRPVLLIDPSL